MVFSLNSLCPSFALLQLYKMPHCFSMTLARLLLYGFIWISDSSCLSLILLSFMYRHLTCSFSQAAFSGEVWDNIPPHCISLSYLPLFSTLVFELHPSMFFLLKVILTRLVSLLVKMLLPHFCQIDLASLQQSLFIK